MDNTNHMKEDTDTEIETTTRPSWDDYFKEIVQVTAKRSPCERLKVGCLLVKDNRIIAQGYNGFLPGASHQSIVINGHEQATVHAEQNAVSDCARRGASCVGATAYITHFPCIYCIKTLCAAGIKNVKYINDYKNWDVVRYIANDVNVEIVKF